MQLFRIFKEAENKYSLRKKLPGNKFKPEGDWMTVKDDFEHPLLAEMHAHELITPQEGLVKEFEL